jgi:hypothetical protein
MDKVDQNSGRVLITDMPVDKGLMQAAYSGELVDNRNPLELAAEALENALLRGAVDVAKVFVSEIAEDSKAIVGRVDREVAEAYRRAGVESPRSNAEFLVSDMLKNVLMSLGAKAKGLKVDDDVTVADMTVDQLYLSVMNPSAGSGLDAAQARDLIIEKIAVERLKNGTEEAGRFSALGEFRRCAENGFSVDGGVDGYVRHYLVREVYLEAAIMLADLIRERVFATQKRTQVMVDGALVDGSAGRGFIAEA